MEKILTMLMYDTQAIETNPDFNRARGAFLRGQTAKQANVTRNPRRFILTYYNFLIIKKLTQAL